MQFGEALYVCLPPSTPLELCKVLGHSQEEGRVQSHIEAFEIGGWTPLFWAAHNGYPLSLWRWLFRMTNAQVQYAMKQLTWKDVKLYTEMAGRPGGR